MSKLLIVDDEPELVSTLAELATLWGLDVATANSGAEAFEIFKQKDIVAILSDISMPEKNGIELLQDIRVTGSDIPLIFLTAHDSKEHMLKAIQLGAAFFVDKPCDPKVLKDLLYKVTDLGRRIKEGSSDKKMQNLLRISMKNNLT